MKHFLVIVVLFFFGESFAADGLHLFTGAERTLVYANDLVGKRIGLVVNQTSVIGETHLVDTFRGMYLNVVKVFAPEHGFRGTADAGAHIKSYKDERTGLPVISLYGKKHAPDSLDLKDVDIIVFDVQDVGCRFYTFLSTLHYVMEACAQYNVDLMILDRPNPNGYTIDGPVLKKGFESFVGIAPIPVMHGLTLGEYARMAKGEQWIKNADSLNLRVIPCGNYMHSMSYNLPIKPSPNLPNAKAVELYPSLCFFEGTNVSVGRGTDFPFQVIGSPTTDTSRGKFAFTPEPREGAKEPFLKGKKCYGFDLRGDVMYGIFVDYLLTMYQLSSNKKDFFLPNLFFDKLAGTNELRLQIIAGKSAKEIKESWKEDLDNYRVMRKKYTLYPL